jgi:FkbM family methyltransferase
MTERTCFDLLLLQTATCYDLTNQAERHRSTADVGHLFYMLQERLRPDLTVEIGAYEAMFSRTMRGHGIRAIAFEANPYNHQFFSDDPRMREAGVEYIHSAVANRDGMTEFHVQKRINGELVDPVRGNNSLFTRTHGQVEYETVSVPVVSLASFFRQNGLVGQSFSAWIDVEGAAYDVLDGAGDMLQSCLTAMVEVEQFSYWRDQRLAHGVMDFLLSRNFIPVARDFEDPHQYNLVFIRQDVMERPEVRDALAMSYSRIGRGAVIQPVA